MHKFKYSVIFYFQASKWRSWTGKYMPISLIVYYFLFCENHFAFVPSAKFQNLPAVRRTQRITIGQNFFNNPCPITTIIA